MSEVSLGLINFFVNSAITSGFLLHLELVLVFSVKFARFALLLDYVNKIVALWQYKECKRFRVAQLRN